MHVFKKINLYWFPFFQSNAIEFLFKGGKGGKGGKVKGKSQKRDEEFDRARKEYEEEMYNAELAAREERKKQEYREKQSAMDSEAASIPETEPATSGHDKSPSAVSSLIPKCRKNGNPCSKEQLPGLFWQSEERFKMYYI